MHNWRPGETITAAKLRSGYASGQATIPFSSGTEVAAGGTIYDGSYWRASVNVTFPAGTFTTAPAVTATVNSSVPGTIMECTITGVTPTGFTINGARGSQDNASVWWIAIEQS